MVEIKAGNTIILLGDGVGLRFLEAGEKHPAKHQLLIELEDGSALYATVQMYGGLWCFIEGDFESVYHQIAREKPSALSDAFSREYFDSLISMPEVQKLSAKAFLATEQRIPGLGNGVLQDILWQAQIHPKTKIKTLTGDQREVLYHKVKTVITEITVRGGRDTEKDLFGIYGGYTTIMSKNSVGQPCKVCGGLIKKGNYMGGSIYFCENCQTI